MNVETEYGQLRAEPRSDPQGVRLVDAIEREQFHLLTSTPVGPEPASTDHFEVPLDAAVAIDARTVETPYPIEVWVWDDQRTLLAADLSEGSHSFERGEYRIELSSTPIKLYLSVRSELTIDVTADRTRFSVPDAPIRLGMRSLHDAPAATITTTDEPRDVMRAVSLLGSALKTTSPERSFPNLRGHPPLIERGPELSIPGGLAVPDTGVTIEVPETLGAVFPVAPLSYYLGATVRPGETARLVTEDWTYSLADGPGEPLERAVRRVLQQVFLLDCATRTEGLYDVDLAVRRRVEDRVDLSFDDLYERPLADRLRAYLDCPYEQVEPAIPRWKVTADVVPDAEYLPALPFLVDELAIVRCPDRPECGVSFFPRPPVGQVREPGPDEATPPDLGSLEQSVFEAPETDSIEQVYLGDGIPLGAGKASVDAFVRRLDREPRETEDISVVVVCNDPEMRAENAVADVYGSRDWLSFDVTTHVGLSTGELADVLTTGADLLHYVGHVRADGIECPDGYLDVRDLDDVGVDAFLLNACRSYQQGRALVDRGAVGGFVTLAAVPNATATRIGLTLARLLNTGFSLLGALGILAEYRVPAREYTVVGDGCASLVPPSSGTALYVTVEDRDPTDPVVTVHANPTRGHGMGTMFQPFLGDDDSWYLNAGPLDTFEPSPGDVTDYDSFQPIPFIDDGDLEWSPDLQ